MKNEGLLILLSLIIGLGAGYLLFKPTVNTTYIIRPSIITIPADTSKGTAKPVIKYVPRDKLVYFNPDSLELDSLRLIAREYQRIAPDFQTHRSDSLLDVTIVSHPTTRETEDSIIVKQREIPHTDTTQINTVKAGLDWYWYPIGAGILYGVFRAGQGVR